MQRLWGVVHVFMSGIKKTNKHLADILSKEKRKETGKERNQAEQAKFHAFVARSSLLFYFLDKCNNNKERVLLTTDISKTWGLDVDINSHHKTQRQP